MRAVALPSLSAVPREYFPSSPSNFTYRSSTFSASARVMAGTAGAGELIGFAPEPPAASTPAPPPAPLNGLRDPPPPPPTSTTAAASTIPRPDMDAPSSQQQP